MNSLPQIYQKSFCLSAVLFCCCLTIANGQVVRVEPEVEASAADLTSLENKLSEQQRQLRDQQERIVGLEKKLNTAVELLQQLARSNTISSNSLAGSVKAADESSSAQISAQPNKSVKSVPIPREGQDISSRPDANIAVVSPLYFKIGTARFSPLGFADLTGFVRSTNVGSGSGTDFGSIPFTSTVLGRLTEARFSAQNSRLGLRIDSAIRNTRVLGYIETDFVGSQPIDGIVTKNSSPLNLRLYFADFTYKKKYEYLAGQAWSLLTPNRIGVSALPNDVFYTFNLDTNYQVGLVWSRIPQLRLIAHPTTQWSVGVSFENPEQYVGNGVTFPARLSNIYTSQLNTGNGTLSVPNMMPDIVSKVAWDGTNGGRHLHVELAGTVRKFRVVAPDTLKRSGAFGGGGSFNAAAELTRGLRVIVNTFVSDGGGRLISGLAPDVVVRDDGRISLVHSFSSLGGIEYSYSPSSYVYSYYGAMYAARNVTVDRDTGALFGFGVPGNPNANRAIQEVTVGNSHTFWRNPYYGALQFNSQVSYLKRNPWDVSSTQFRGARLYMAFLNIRYILP